MSKLISDKLLYVSGSVVAESDPTVLIYSYAVGHNLDFALLPKNLSGDFHESLNLARLSQVWALNFLEEILEDMDESTTSVLSEHLLDQKAKAYYYSDVTLQSKSELIRRLRQLDNWIFRSYVTFEESSDIKAAAMNRRISFDLAMGSFMVLHFTKKSTSPE